jgi:HEAT repeat protein
VTQPPQIAFLVHCLGNPRLRKRQHAARRLVRVGSDAVPALIEAAASPSREVRLEAARALAEMRDPAGFDAILKQLDDPDSFVQYEAAYDLGVLGDERAVGPLVERLRRSDDSGASNGAAQFVDRLGSAAVGPLLQVMADGSPDAKACAAHNLASIGDESALEPVAKLADTSDGMQRVAAVEALGRFGWTHPERFGERCIALIAKYADDAHEDVRGAVEGETENIREAIQELTAIQNKPGRSRHVKLLVGEKRRWNRSSQALSRMFFLRRRCERRGVACNRVYRASAAEWTWRRVRAMRARKLNDY